VITRGGVRRKPARPDPAGIGSVVAEVRIFPERVWRRIADRKSEDNPSRKGEMQRPIAAILFLSCAAAVPRAATGQGFGQRHVWRVPDSAVEALHKCTGRIRQDCVKKVMKADGATPEAYEFYRKSGWFLSELKETEGRVSIATLVDPWRANENEQPALVGGKPPIVYPEETDVDPQKSSGFRSLLAEYPNLLFWKPGPVLEGTTSGPKGQSFVFRYRLLDGCHACAVRGFARVEFLFAPDGTFRRAALLGILPN